MSILIDSNIWAYYFDSTTPEHKKVVNPIRRALQGEVWINTVIQIEVTHYLVKRLGPVLGAEKAEKFLSYPLMSSPLSGCVKRLKS